MKKIRTHYDNLQIIETASPEVIKGAYRHLSQKWHPDKNPNQRKKAERVMRLVNDAYAVLSDPVRRREHDNWIKERRSRQEDIRDSQFENTTVERTSDQAQGNVVFSERKWAWGSLAIVLWLIWLTAQNDNNSKPEIVFAHSFNEQGPTTSLETPGERLIRLAKQGNAKAQNHLGIMYYNGQGVAKDYKKAIRWFLVAAKQGFAEAQYYLGVISANGEGVPQDKAMSVYWYTKAAEQGNTDAQKNLARIKKRMNEIR